MHHNTHEEYLMAENQFQNPVQFGALLAEVPGFEKAAKRGRIFRTPQGNALVEFRNGKVVISFGDGDEILLDRADVERLI